MSIATRINGNTTTGGGKRAKSRKASGGKPTVHELALNAILDDTDLQPRTSMDLEVMREYTVAWLEGAEFPPIVVFFDGENHWLADGFYRTRSARKAMLTSIRAMVYDGDKRDAKLYSAGANANHGLRRSNEDKKKAVIKLLDDPEWCLWTNEAIAKHCRVSESSVSRFREGSPGLRGHDVAVRIGKDGAVHDTRSASPGSKDIGDLPAETFRRPPTLMTKAEVAGEFVSKIARHLRKADPTTRVNAPYDFGECEIATSTHLYCFAVVPDRHQLYASVGRMMVCRQCLNPSARIVVIGHFPRSVADLIRRLAEMGVECRTPEQVLAD